MEELRKRIYDKHNGLHYTSAGDYYIPDPQLSEETRLTGIWRRIHKGYLTQYHPVLYSELISSGKLWTYLVDLNEQAQKQMNRLISRMKAVESITEELKAHDPMAWMGTMGNIRNRTEEVVRSEMIYH